MAVPKKKTSHQKKNMRRSHLALKPINVIMDSNTGEYRLPHRMCAKDKSYNGKEVIARKFEE